MIRELQFQNFASSVTEGLENEINRGNVEICDYSSAEFTINYDNRLELENIEVNTDIITDELHEILLDKFQEHFGNLITDKSE